MGSLSDPAKRYTDEQKQEIKRLYERGYSTQLIEEITGIRWQTCRRFLKTMGVSLRKPGRPKGSVYRNKKPSSYTEDGQWRVDGSNPVAWDSDSHIT
jgi:hypothetical protein